jgi:DNA-binding MurR/RpiR family transcriptional regulator
MTASDERVALRGICACTVRISEEEVSDFCSVLSLADRVFVAGSADAVIVAALFRLGLAEFGFDAHVLDTATVRHVEPAETRRRDRRTTAGCGPTRSRRRWLIPTY